MITLSRWAFGILLGCLVLMGGLCLFLMIRIVHIEQAYGSDYSSSYENYVCSQTDDGFYEQLCAAMKAQQGN